MRKALWDIGIRGYRVHWKKAPGKPDIAFPGRKIAVFVHGCFWHRCPHCDLPLPGHNPDYWRYKFRRNLGRDATNQAELDAMGWKSIVIWECKMKEDLSGCVEVVRRAVEA